MPDLVHELLFGYQAIPMPYEVGQHLQHLRFYVLGYSCALQLEAVQIHRTSANWYTPPSDSVACCADPSISTFSPRQRHD